MFADMCYEKFTLIMIKKTILLEPVNLWTSSWLSSLGFNVYQSWSFCSYNYPQFSPGIKCVAALNIYFQMYTKKGEKMAIEPK